MELPNSGEQYKLKWNNHLANFVEKFVERQTNESLVDITLSCEGQFIKTHKLVLSACSDYFHNLLQAHGNLQHPIIFLNQARFDDLKCIINFMYQGEVKVLDKDLPNVLALGEALQIKGLSSVKLRGMPPPVPPLADVQPPPPKLAKKNSKKECNSKKPKLSSPVQNTATLPEPPLNVFPLNNKPLFDYSKSNLKKFVTLVPKPDGLPIISSVCSIPAENNVPLVLPAPVTTVPSESSVSPLKNSFNSVMDDNLKNEPMVTSSNVNCGSPKESQIPPIPSPPHAFMIFANEWRKKLTVEHPEENNKEISVRLGTMWKNLLPETKNIYYREAKRAEEEHKLRYPNYVSPAETLKRKSDVLNNSASTTPSPQPVLLEDSNDGNNSPCSLQIAEEITVSDDEP